MTETRLSTQEQIDSIYDEFCKTIINEMEELIPQYDWSVKTKKRMRVQKPYWNDELTNLWKTMSKHEQ